MKVRSLFCVYGVFVVWMVFASSGFALINFGSNDATYTTDPEIGSAWDAVVSIAKVGEDYNASAIYLGDGFFLTANHVTATDGSQLTINGVTFTLDTGFNGTGVLKVGNIPGMIDNPDLKLFRVLQEPVNIAIATLNTDASKDTGTNAYMIGYGKGKGTEVVGKGWNWGGDSTRAERWGVSQSLSAGLYDAGGYKYQVLVTEFEASYGNNVANGTDGDSGGGLFRYIDNEWKLVGVMTGVSVAESSYYDRNGNPDITAYVRISSYAPFILSVIPEPSAWVLSTFGAMALLAGGLRKKTVSGK